MNVGDDWTSQELVKVKEMANADEIKVQSAPGAQAQLVLRVQITGGDRYGRRRPLATDGALSLTAGLKPL